MGGPGAWLNYGLGQCGSTSLRCMGKTKASTVSPVITSGRKVWLTSAPFAIGTTETPDARCQSDRPAGVTTAVALIGRTDRVAAAVFDPTKSYSRIDGTFLGYGSTLSGGGGPLSGIWQASDGSYRSVLALVGSNGSTTLGTTFNTCNNWTSNTVSNGFAVVTAGLSSASNIWWSGYAQIGCGDISTHLYCVQTAP